MPKTTIDWAEVQAEKERLAAMTLEEIYADKISTNVLVMQGAITALKRKRPGVKQEIQKVDQKTGDAYYYAKQIALFQVFSQYGVLGAYFGEDARLAQHQETQTGWATTLRPPNHPLLFVVTFTQDPAVDGKMVFKQVTEAQRIRA